MWLFAEIILSKQRLSINVLQLKDAQHHAAPAMSVALNVKLFSKLNVCSAQEAKSLNKLLHLNFKLIKVVKTCLKKRRNNDLLV